MSDYGPPDDLYDESAGCHPDELADLLRLVRDTRKKWADLEAIIEADLGLTAGVGQHETYIVRQASEKVEWDHDGVRSEILKNARYAAKVAKRPEGEVVADWIWKCVPGSPQWRVGGLKALGINPSDYRQRIPGRRTVELLPVTPPVHDADMSGDER